MHHYLYLIKQAWVSLQQNKGFFTAVVITMGVTIGALLCVSTLAYLLLLKPLPYPEQQSLYKVDHVSFNGNNERQTPAYTYPGLIHLYKNQEVFDGTALIAYGEDVLTSLSQPTTMHTAYVTPEWFSLLGSSFVMGRGFEETEALDTNIPVAILSYETWVNKFNKAADILSKKVSFRGDGFRIIGVLNESFTEPQIHGLGIKTQIWFPWDFNLDTRYKESWGGINFNLAFVGTIKDGLTVNQAQKILTPLVNETWQKNVVASKFYRGWRVEIELLSFSEVILGDSRKAMYFLLAGVLGLLLIAFTNIANLFMSRAAGQVHQYAIHTALGAKKHHIFTVLFVEASVLMLVSVFVSLAIAVFGFTVFKHYLSEIFPRTDELNLNLFTFSVAISVAIVFASLLAYLNSKVINYRSLNSRLQSSGKGTGVQLTPFIRSTLIVSQVTVATVLIFTNLSLFQDSLDSINDPLGFELNNISYLSVSTSAPQPIERKKEAALMDELSERLEYLPQVESISQSRSPLSRFGTNALTMVVGNEKFVPESKGVDEQYFQMIKQPLLKGDDFTEIEAKNRTRVMIVNEVFANRITPDGNVLGLKVDFGNDYIVTITGVVKGVKMPGEINIPIRFYYPSKARSSLLIKLYENQSLPIEQVVKELNEVSSTLSVFELQSLNKNRQKRLFTRIITVVTTASITIITLFLAAIGLFGIFSFSTQMRRLELGVRMAIGARRRDVVKLIIKDNVSMILLGMATSMVVMLGGYIVYKESLATYINISLLPIFGLTLITIAALSLFACYWPLRKYINQPAINSLRGTD